jgi:hypothetical protein
MAAGSDGILQHPTPATTDGHGLCGLSEASSVEGLSKGAPSGTYRELSGTVVTTDGPSFGKVR